MLFAKICHLEHNNEMTNKNWKPIDNGYFSNEYQAVLKKKDIPEKDIKNIINDAKDILSKSINPSNLNITEKLSSTNLVLGYIQSGKTTSMEAVACLARDNGFKIIVILSGHVSNLTGQTKKRVYESLNMYGWDRIDFESGIDHQITTNKLRGIISSQDSILLDEKEKPSLLIVGMGHWATIEKIAIIFEKAKESGVDLKKLPALIIDDECDHHSLDTKFKSKTNLDSDKVTTHTVNLGETLLDISLKYNVPIDMLKYLNQDLLSKILKKNNEDIDDIKLEAGIKILIEKEESTTHRKIKRLRQSLDVHTFLGYTATPLANFLISTVNYLSPKSGTVLKAGSLYTGANYFFGTSDQINKHVIQIEDDIVKSKEKPPSLAAAIRIFVLGVAFGINNGDHLKKKSRSMLIHPSIQTPLHEQWKNWAAAEIHRYYKAYESKALKIKDNTTRVDVYFEEIEKEFLDSYKELKKTENNLPNYDDKFIINIAKALKSIDTQIIKLNASDGSIPFIEWGEDGVYARILVGGIGLERGYTIEGLTVSYIVRESGTDDAVYQRARFFGYHMSYIGLVRMYLPHKLIENFTHQQEQEIIIRNKIQEVVNNNGNLRRDLRRSFPYIKDPVRKSIISHEIKKYPSGGTVVDNKAHHLDPESIRENQELYKLICKSGMIKKCSEITNHSYKNSLGNISVIEDLNLTEFSEKFLKKLNFFEDSADDYDVLIDLVEWRRIKNKEDLKIAVMIMNDDENNFTRRVDDIDFLEQSSRIPIESGANRSRPGHAYLHYEFLSNPESLPWSPTKNNDSPYGTPAAGTGLKKANEIATLQLYKFDIVSKNNPATIKTFNNFELKDVPYFRLYIPKILGTGFLATEQKN
jgi:hypothetical protein